MIVRVLWFNFVFEILIVIKDEPDHSRETINMVFGVGTKRDMHYNTLNIMCGRKKSSL